MAEGVVLGALPPDEGEEWTTTEVVIRTGMDRRNLRRWARGKGIAPTSATAARGGELRWPALAVWTAWQAGGKGNRTTGPERSEASRQGHVTRRGDGLG